MLLNQNIHSQIIQVLLVVEEIILKDFCEVSANQHLVKKRFRLATWDTLLLGIVSAFEEND